MPYIGRDGTVGGQEQKSVRRKITDFFAGIFNFIALFFSAITNPPSIESRGNYAQRNNNNPYRAEAEDPTSEASRICRARLVPKWAGEVGNATQV
eukprot:jgi/Psemu1/64527/estExt_Genemark1.C_680093